MKKLLALAERGEGGEADNARRILNRLLVAYGLTLEDLASDKRKRREFAYKTKDERTLFVMILTNLFGSKSEIFQEATYDTKHKLLYVDLTEIEYIDLSNMWTFFRPLFNRERDRLLSDATSAFIMKHSLYDSDHESTDSDEEIDWARIERILELSRGMENVTYRKQLE